VADFWQSRRRLGTRHRCTDFPNGTSWNGSNTSSGWLWGAGIEYGFKDHWTIKIEYDYLALQNWTAPTVLLADVGRNVQMIKAGINYKFEAGLAGRAPKAGAKEASTGDLATKSQNPIADMVSVPFQNNANFKQWSIPPDAEYSQH